MKKAENEGVANLIQSANTIAVVPSRVAGSDAFCAAAGLYYMLLDDEKDVYFVYNGKVPDAVSSVMDKKDISSNVSQRELVVSVDYSNSPASSAHYSTDEGVLEIKVGPVPRDFDKRNVTAKLVGYDFDMIITVGALELRDLGGSFNRVKEEFKDAKIVNIDNTSMNSKFGDEYVIDDTASSLSMLVYKKASGWSLYPGEKAAKALLTGITIMSSNNAVDDS